MYHRDYSVKKLQNCINVLNVCNVTKVVVIAWFIAVVCAVPMVTQFGIVYIDDPTTGQPMAESATCDVMTERKLPYSFEVWLPVYNYYYSF